MRIKDAESSKPPTVQQMDDGSHGSFTGRFHCDSLLSKTAFLRIRVVDFKGHTHLLLLTNAGPFGIAS